MFSVLHISDLHRSLEDPISNDELIASIIEDLDRVRTRRPWSEELSAIIVSGDIVQGCKLDQPNYQAELAQQYACARDFLLRLTDELLGGDKRRLVVVPGNHDVCWNISRAAMKERALGKDEKVQRLLAQPSGPYRWDWNSLMLFEIDNAVVYAERLNAYRSFFDDLYGSERPEQIAEDVYLYVIDGVAVVGFNSCHSIDCFNFGASISGEAIAKASLWLRKSEFEAKIAVWHHNLEGPPHSNDYMRHECVRRLAYYGFGLGLHGHQHHSGASTVYVHSDRHEVMATVGAASLCAGRKELPTGRHRGFNLLFVDTDRNEAEVWARAMDLDTVSSPEFGFNGGSAHKVVTWTPRVKTEGLTAVVLAAEAALRAGDALKACALLVPRSTQLDDYGDALLFDACIRCARLADAEAVVQRRPSAEKAVKLCIAYIEGRHFAFAERVLMTHSAAVPTPLIRELRQRMKLSQLALGGQNGN